MRRNLPLALLALEAFFLTSCITSTTDEPLVRTGQAALGEYLSDAPGVWRKISPKDLPEPYATPGARNPPKRVSQPDGVAPQALPGFTTTLFASGLQGPRRMRVAPNGDIFVTESLVGKIKVLRANPGDEKADKISVFLSDLNRPFGIAFYPKNNPRWLYVANTDSVVRYPYKSGDLTASGPAEVIIPKIPTGGHATRDLAFSPDGSKLFISVGSASNDGTNMPKKTLEEAIAWASIHGMGAAWGAEKDRAQVWVSTPEGKDVKPYATGIRNCSGLTVNPVTSDLWCSTNERDMLGDDLVPDYSTRVKVGQHYGWPWHYIGSHEDPRLAGQRPDLADKVATPDILYQSHSAPLQMIFYTQSTGSAAFPPEYDGEGFVTLHGSWNRKVRTGYKVVRARLKNGVPTGEYQDFLVGFVKPDGDVWGRPVGIVQAKDGSLLVSDDGGNVIWRVAYSGSN